MQKTWIRDGSREYQRAGMALFLIGFICFSLLYLTQPLLPDFAKNFGLSAAQSSLALSLTTGSLAISIMVFAAYSESLGRRGLMFVCLASASLLNIVAAFTPSWLGLLSIRTLQGLLLGGVPAVAMAWLAEEIEPKALPKTMGLYIAGTAFGGMIGRIGVGLLAALCGWRAAFFIWGLLCAFSSAGFFASLPRSRNFRAAGTFLPMFHLRIWSGHLRNENLQPLFLIGFTLSSIFVTCLNYAAFRLSGAPFQVSQKYISWIYLIFLIGMVVSVFAGHIQKRFERGRILKTAFILMLVGQVLTLSNTLAITALGFSVTTAGFFVGHSVASSSVGAMASKYKGHAASLYLLCYYQGSSLVGTMGGWFWQLGAWNSVVALTVSLAIMGTAISAAVRRPGETLRP